MSLPKVSIITPTYNQADFIEETIQSVINQSYPNIEYIIIDGGSTDNTIDVIKKYEKHIHYWVSEPDEGQSDAINKGLKIATGDIVNWLNSDDYLYPDAIKIVVDEFNKGHNCITGLCNIIDQNGNSLFTNLGSFVDYSSYSNTLKYLIIEQPSTYFSKEAVEKMGELNKDLHFIMDKEWWLKYLIEYKTERISSINQYISYFRFQPQSKTTSQSNRFIIDMATLLYSLCKFKSFNTYADVIEKKYDVNKDYKFSNQYANELSKDFLIDMLQGFFLKFYSNVFNKKDFEASRYLKSKFIFDTKKMDLMDLSNHNRLIKNTKPKNWFLFKLNRKYKYLLRK